MKGFLGACSINKGITYLFKVLNVYVWIFKIHTVKCGKKLNHARFQIQSLLVKRQDNTRRCTLYSRVKILSKSLKIRLSLNCGGPLPWTMPSPSISSTLAMMKNNITIIWIWKERKKKTKRKIANKSRGNVKDKVIAEKKNTTK